MYTKKPKEMGSLLMMCGVVYCLNTIKYSTSHKYCNKNSSSSSTIPMASYCIIKGIVESSGTGAGVFVAIFMTGTV